MARTMSEAPVFVDTGYLIALINRRDRLHPQAKTLAQRLDKAKRGVLTTDGVLIEFANFFAASPLRLLAGASIRRIRSTRGWVIERLTDKLLERAEARYTAHADKSWSLTDCLSMEVMLDHGALETATPDHHFLQAGFRILLKARM
jgi:uncharacterized protein